MDIVIAVVVDAALLGPLRVDAALLGPFRLQRLHGWSAAPFQNGALALAPRTFVLTVCSSYKDS